jgi:hypothetical protein
MEHPLTRFLLGLLTLSALFMLAACGGGGGGGGDTVKQGQFLDSAVSGVRYETASQSGTTNASGSFNYKAGEGVKFYIGDILLGVAAGQASLTPVDMVPGASDETNPQVTNIIRFLQTLDDDADPGNGIAITSAVANLAGGMNINFDQSIADFAADGSVQTAVSTLTSVLGSPRTLVSQTTAQAHFRGTLLGLYAGVYSGSFNGDVSGTWSFTVSNSGQISGNAVSTDGTLAVSGQLASDGSANISGSAGMATFNGSFSLDGSVSGQWNDTTTGESGSFSGSRASSGGDGSSQVTAAQLVGIWRRLDSGNTYKGKEYLSDGTGWLGNFNDGPFTRATSLTWSLNGNTLTDQRVDGTRVENVTAFNGTLMTTQRLDNSHYLHWQKQ